MFALSVYAEQSGLAAMFRGAEEVIVALTPGADSSLDAAVANVTHALMIAATGHSPVWFGVLQAAHRAEAQGAQGRVFIQSGITHPLGGHPDQYGQEVHQRKPWFRWTLEQDAPGILEHELFELNAQVKAAWQGRLFS